MSIIDGDHNPLRIRLRPRPRFSVEDLILARLRGDIPNVTPDERMDDFIGVEEPPDPLEAGPEESALPGPSFLERFGANVQQEPFIAQPEGFGQGLVAGLAGGLQRRGQRSAQRRAEAERAIRERRAERESLNRAATEQYRRDRAAAMRELAKETRGERRTVEGEERAEARTRRLRLTPEEIEAEAFARARGTRRGAPPVAARGAGGGLLSGKLPSAGERDKLIADAAALEQTSEIEKLFRPEFVGPIRGRVGAVQVATGKGVAPGEADFRGALAIYRNAVINAISGAAVSESEAKRLRQQIPQETDPSDVFVAKLRQTRKNIERLSQQRKSVMSRTGIDLSGIGGGDANPDGLDDEAAYRLYLQTIGGQP